MSITVDIWDINAAKVLEIVHDLRKEGMIQGLDFDFSFNPVTLVDYQDGYLDSQKASYGSFTFHTEKYATYFILKYKQ